MWSRQTPIITLLSIIIVASACLSAAIPYDTLVTISRRATYDVELSPLGQVVDSRVTVKIGVRNNSSYVVMVDLRDLEEDVGIVEVSPVPVWREPLAPGYELLGWSLGVPPRESLEVVVRGVPLEDPPLRVEVYYYVNGEPAYPYRRGDVWKLKVGVGDRLKIAIRLVNELPRLFDGRGYVKVPLSVLVTIPFPGDVLELEESSMEPSKLMVNSWLLIVLGEEWLNATYRVEDLGAWGEVNLNPITITYSPIQQALTLAESPEEARHMAETLLALKETLASLRGGVEAASQALRLMSDALNTPPAVAKSEIQGHELSGALRRYADYLEGLAGAVGSMSGQASRSYDLLIQVISSIDPSLLANPSPELQELMYRLSLLSQSLRGVSVQLGRASASLKEMSEAVEGLENATESLSVGLTALSEELSLLSRQLRSMSDQLSAVEEGLYSVEAGLAVLSKIYEARALVLAGQERVRSFQQALLSVSRAWGFLGSSEPRAAVGYRLSREGGYYVLSDIRVRCSGKCTVTWLRLEVRNGRIRGLRIGAEGQGPANMTSIRVEVLNDSRVVLLPVFSEAGGELVHPLVGEYSIIIESSGRPDVTVTPLCVWESDYVAVERQDVTYRVSVGMPILSQEVPPELPPISAPEKPRQGLEPLYLALVSTALLAALWYARRVRRRGLEDAELEEVEEEVRELERKLSSSL